MSQSNSGSFYFNTNESRSFSQTLSTVLVALSSFPCSEVLIVNRTNDDLFVFDNNNFSNNNRFLLKNDESMVIRGVTNSNMISARTSLSGGNIFYRTSRFSNYNQG